MNETNQDSAGSKPALKHIKAYECDHTKVTAALEKVRVKFFETTQARGLQISNKGKGRALIPGYPEALNYLLSGEPLDEFIEKLIQRATGAQ